MKKYTLLLLIISLLVACNQSIKPRELVSVTIEEFKLDSTSIRAIEIVNDSTIAYAGSIGDIGIVTTNGVFKDKRAIKTDTIIPHFRALATSNDALFVLNVGNPALLYKYKNNSLEIVYNETHEKVFYDSMQFFDEMNGIAIGDPTNDCLSIIITNDGGKTWNKIGCKDIPKIEEGEAAFAASNTNIAVVRNNAWVVTGGLTARIFHTSDKGLTWNVYKTPIIQGKNTTGIYSVDFYNENQGIICGGDYTDKFGKSANKAITIDGGKTWEVVAENVAPKYVSCVQYVPNTEGKEVFAVSTNGIFYSNNSGRSWMKVSDKGFYSIRFVSKNLAWLSGNEVLAKMIIK